VQESGSSETLAKASEESDGCGMTNPIKFERPMSKQMPTAHCVVCGVSLGKQSKRAQWQKLNCFDCGEKANALALDQDIEFGVAIEQLKEKTQVEA
jgi:hypothetical protein